MNNGLKIKNALNLLWLIVLVLFTPTIGMLLNYDVFKFRSVLLLLIWMVVLLIPYILTQRKWLYITAASLLFADGFVNLFHWIVLKCPLNASSIFVFLNTNFNEASEFMAIKMTPLLLLFIPYIALFIIVLKRIPQLSFRSKGEIIVWSALWLFVVIYFADNIIHKRFLRSAVPDVECAVISFIKESEEYNKLESRNLFQLDAVLTTDDPTLIVIVVGESCNRNHMSLYGYGRETTPRLNARQDILVFDNVVSANSNTLYSVMNFLTENNMEHHRPLDSCIHIFDVLHSTPYRSYWISNQAPIGLWENGVTNLVQNADVKTFVNVTSSSSMESTQTASYDQQLFVPLQSAISDTAKHKVVFLHLLGCHTQYNKRYPNDFALFEDKGDKRTRNINTYDNAVYYNDFIVDSVFSMLKTYSLSHPEVRVSALYFSDHGENVYDEGDYCGHNYSDIIPNANVEIPFILWLSPSQKKYLDAHNYLVTSQLHTPYMIDDLFHTIIDLCGIAIPCFDKTRSFLNPDFNSTRPRILEDGNVYCNRKTN
ncbi:MAG: phosphoethanolamine transferase [Bacteroidales bacterium]|nr:phosphoethanolamine transferase [Bacteroidales bacterium]